MILFVFFGITFIGNCSNTYIIGENPLVIDCITDIDQEIWINSTMGRFASSFNTWTDIEICSRIGGVFSCKTKVSEAGGYYSGNSVGYLFIKAKKRTKLSIGVVNFPYSCSILQISNNNKVSITMKSDPGCLFNSASGIVRYKLPQSDYCIISLKPSYPSVKNLPLVSIPSTNASLLQWGCSVENSAVVTNDRTLPLYYTDYSILKHEEMFIPSKLNLKIGLLDQFLQVLIILGSISLFIFLVIYFLCFCVISKVQECSDQGIDTIVDESSKSALLSDI